MIKHPGFNPQCAWGAGKGNPGLQQHPQSPFHMKGFRVQSSSRRQECGYVVGLSHQWPGRSSVGGGHLLACGGPGSFLTTTPNPEGNKAQVREAWLQLAPQPRGRVESQAAAGAGLGEGSGQRPQGPAGQLSSTAHCGLFPGKLEARGRSAVSGGAIGEARAAAAARCPGGVPTPFAGDHCPLACSPRGGPGPCGSLASLDSGFRLLDGDSNARAAGRPQPREKGTGSRKRRTTRCCATPEEGLRRDVPSSTTATPYSGLSASPEPVPPRSPRALLLLRLRPPG